MRRIRFIAIILQLLLPETQVREADMNHIAIFLLIKRRFIFLVDWLLLGALFVLYQLLIGHSKSVVDNTNSQA